MKVYQKLIIQTRQSMQSYRPSQWQWLSLAKDVNEYIRIIRKQQKEN